ncbi:MAG: Fe-S-containing hydro-lyase [Lachnospiraceae bacterium]|nr:Fe-S-containing hydro-lyase [Lachnospiraceae bacterium]
MNEKMIQIPFASQEEILALHAGDEVLLSGTLYTARDAAHKRMSELLAKGEPLPFPLENQTIYYLGPSPARPGQVIGSAGPTTATRMDRYTPQLLDLGLKGMIGKGRRSEDVVNAMIRNGAVYFAAIGGAGALLSKAITQSEVIAWEDLGTEAVRKLTIKNFPAIVVIDAAGKSLYT